MDIEFLIQRLEKMFWKSAPKSLFRESCYQ
jgi:hypothetical protein